MILSEGDIYILYVTMLNICLIDVSGEGERHLSIFISLFMLMKFS